MSDARDPSGFWGIRHRVRYRFDNLLARGTWPVLVWLGVLTFAALVVSALLLALSGVDFTGGAGTGWLEDFWQSLLRVLDTGTMAGDVGWGRRLLALAITLFGVLVAGTLIGVIASGVEQRIDRMRKGRSVVVETDHLVVLGTSERIPLLAQQLVLAHADQSDRAIVFLTSRDPSEVSDDVDRVVEDRRGVRLVFRSGDPTRPNDLVLARLARARAVIVLADPDGGDSRSVKSVLAVGASLGGFDRLPIVVELNDPANAASLLAACGGAVHPIIASAAAARIAAFALRERGLSQVIHELLDYRGSDVHVVDLPDLVGRPFSEVIGRYAKARPIGLLRADGSVELAPPHGARFADGDRLVVIADDAHSLDPSEHEFGEWRQDPAASVAVDLGDDPERLLIRGWNRLAPPLLDYWDAVAPPGSTVEVAFDADLIGVEEVASLDPARVTVTPFKHGDPPLRLADGSQPTTVVLLAYADHLPVSEADSRTLLDLLVLRGAYAAGDDTPRIVVELLDVDDLPLAQLSGADDYLVSQATGSQFIAQLAEQPDRRPVYLELYAPDGPTIHLVPAGRLDLVGEFSMAEIVSSAYRLGLLAIGWRSITNGDELTLNPHESTRVDLAAVDEIVVIG